MLSQKCFPETETNILATKRPQPVVWENAANAKGSVDTICPPVLFGCPFLVVEASSAPPLTPNAAWKAAVHLGTALGYLTSAVEQLR